MVVKEQVMSDAQAGLHLVWQLTGAQLVPIEDGAADCVRAARMIAAGLEEFSKNAIIYIKVQSE
jgi:hypothetical protein